VATQKVHIKSLQYKFILYKLYTIQIVYTLHQRQQPNASLRSLIAQAELKKLDSELHRLRTKVTFLAVSLAVPLGSLLGMLCLV